MPPIQHKFSPLAELAPSSIPKIPLVSRLPKTFPMAYGLILKTTITNIINVLLNILIISPPWSFSPIATICFRFSPNLPHVLSACTNFVIKSLHPIKYVTHPYQVQQRKFIDLKIALTLHVWLYAFIYIDSRLKRNARIFAGMSRTPNLVFDQIECIIREKLDLMRNTLPIDENIRI